MIVSAFYKAHMKDLKRVTKLMIWKLYWTARQEADASAEARNAEPPPATGRLTPLPEETDEQSEAPIHGDEMQIDEENNPFVVPDACGPSGSVSTSEVPQTPQRAHPSQSYPTPPSTTAPPIRRVPSTVSPVAAPPAHDIMNNGSNTAAHQQQALQDLQRAHDDVLEERVQHITLLAQHEAQEEERDTQLLHAEGARNASEARAAATQEENAGLREDIAHLRVQKVFGRAALVASQKQVEKRDEEAAGMLRTLAQAVGITRWAPAWMR
ncbi:hypothetical protein C8Q77DRAFT_230820 [Trametes polyzona]|nr:hypothetical protein C8Q77DRAFT_230820 [Trametes polyzona]